MQAKKDRGEHSGNDQLGNFLAENTRDTERTHACLIGAQLIAQFVVSTWHAAAFVLVSFVVLVGTHKLRSCFVGVGWMLMGGKFKDLV